MFTNFGLKKFQYLKKQNVSISPHYILPTHDPPFSNSFINISTSFFSSFYTQKLRYHATTLIIHLPSFKCFMFFKFNLVDKKDILTRREINTICLTKKVF